MGWTWKDVFEKAVPRGICPQLPTLNPSGKLHWGRPEHI